jgi:hypothetical protein
VVEPLILLLMRALFTFISSRPAFQGEGTGEVLINASSVFTAAAAMVVLAFRRRCCSGSYRSCRPRPPAWGLTAGRLLVRLSLRGQGQLSDP